MSKLAVVAIGGNSLIKDEAHKSVPEQFDAVLHFDETRAVEPLECTAEWDAGELPETFPFAV